MRPLESFSSVQYSGNGAVGAGRILVVPDERVGGWAAVKEGLVEPLQQQEKGIILPLR